MSITDVFRSHKPVSIVFIGGEAVLCKNYNFTVNNKNEAQVGSAVLALEAVEAKVFADNSVVDNIHEIEIWTGYVEDVLDINQQIAQLKKQLKNKEKPKTLVKRFTGIITQPEWEIGTNGAMLNLSFGDVTTLLREYKYYDNFEDGATEVKNILKSIEKDIKGLTIICDDYPGSARLGTYDQFDKKQTYHCGSKSYYEIIRECAAKLGYIIIVDGKTIHLTSQKKNPHIWPMYYGPRDKQKIADEQKGQYFDNLRFRYGEKGRIEKSEVVVEVTGTDWTKKGKEKHQRVVFPEDKAITSVTKYKKINISGDVRKRDLQSIAENEYRKLASRLITGSLDLKFANPFIDLWDIIEFVDESDEGYIKHLAGFWFNVCSISETYNESEYSQTVEFESDVTLPNTVKRKIAPVYKTKGK
jgi:hypothetical protein